MLSTTTLQSNKSPQYHLFLYIKFSLSKILSIPNCLFHFRQGINATTVSSSFSTKFQSKLFSILFVQQLMVFKYQLLHSLMSISFCPKQLHLVIYSRHVGVVAIFKIGSGNKLFTSLRKGWSTRIDGPVLTFNFSKYTFIFK